jgi:hypothetical protein
MSGSTGGPLKGKKKCPECGKGSVSQSGLHAHVRTYHPEEFEAKYRVRASHKRTVGQRVRNGLVADLKVAEVIHNFFPHGIQTDDVNQLITDLYFIDQLRQRARGA